MTAAQVTDRRTTKAAGIFARNECTLLECGAVRVVDTQTGSGTPHYVLNGMCDCTDYRRGNRNCKHCIATNELLKQRGVLCSSCGAPTESIQAYVGGRGYCGFIVCSADHCHPARRVN